MARILITPRSLTSEPPPELDSLRDAGHQLVFCSSGETPDEAELLRLVPDIDGWLAGVEPVSSAVIAAAGRLRVISRNGSGVDNLPLAATTERGICVERALAANAPGVAELAVGLALSACRSIPEVAGGVRAGAWPRPKGREIDGATVGIVGLGAIGRKVAAVMAALGANVLAADPLRPPLGSLEGRVSYADLDDVLRRADILSLHCPLPEDGRPLIGAGELETMPTCMILVNTARAGLVDEMALRSALEQGRVAIYATDVFATEPPLPGSLFSHAQVIATSHIGGLTGASIRRATEIAVANLLKHLPGEDHAAE